jgi:transmembrane sensor
MSGPDDAVARLEAEAQQWLVRLRGDGPSNRAAFEDWYCASPDHAAAYDRVLLTWEASAHLTRAGRNGSARSKWSSWRPVAAAVAAAMLLMVGIGVATLAGVGRGPADAFSLVTKVGEIRTDRLPDGTRVTLDTDSRVDAVFTASRRQLRLVRGRARIAAASDARRPMELDAASVTVGDGEVVDLMRRSGLTTITMLDGAGSVHVGQQSVPLSAGQMLAVADTGPAAVPSALRDGDTRWPSGMLSFEDAALAVVVGEASRYSQTRIALDGDDVARLRFTGTFRGGDAAGLAHMLAKGFHLRLSRGPDGSFILSAPTGK